MLESPLSFSRVLNFSITLFTSILSPRFLLSLPTRLYVMIGFQQRAIAAIAASTSLFGYATAAVSSTDAPVDGLPFDESYFTKTVASVQNTYCGVKYNKPGLQIDDQTLLYAHGTGDLTQRANIYHSTSLGLIVAYEGSNLTSFTSSLRDFIIPLAPAHPALGLSPDGLVDAGFQNAWAGTWDDVKHSLYEAKNTYPNASIVITGHSQGAGAAVLGALAINKEFGSPSIDKVIAYGVPRVGNPAYADQFDQALKGKYVGVTNGNDWVPSVAFRAMGYQHPSGMVWINPSNTTSWKFYPGQENIYGPNTRTPEYFYPGTLNLFWGDHQGTYMHSALGTNDGGPCPAVVGGH